jgi:hypothetical protein
MKTITLTLALMLESKALKNRLARWRVLAATFLFVASTASATDLVWVGGSGNWNAAGNWSPAQLPTAADTAIITNTGTYTVTLPPGSTGTAGTITVGGTSGTQTLAIDRATLTIGGVSVINANGHLDFLVSQSILTGAGNLTVNGTVNWANGTMSGTGTTTIGSGGLLAIGSGGVTFGRTLNNGGSGTWSGGNLTMSAGVVFNNLAGGTFDITADGRLSGTATTPINNSGFFRQTAGTVSTIVTAPFNNNGTLQVLAATLSLNLGGTHTGTMSNALGATLNFGGGSHVLTASSFVTGAGILSVSGGATTLTASGSFDAGSTLSVTASNVTLASGCNVTAATLNIGSGILNYNSAGSVAVLNLSAGTLGGTSPVTVTGPLTLGGGTITNALVTAAGGLAINGNTTLNGGKLVNPGLATWSAGNFTGANGAVFSNLFGGTFNNTFDGILASGAGTTPVFVNAGSFLKTGATAPAGTTSIDFQFINTGTVEVQTNTLRYGINQQTAGLTLLDGGGLSAQAQPIQLLGGGLVGTGLVTVANLQNVINSATISPGLPLGELDISGNYQQTASGVLNIELGGYSAGTNFDLVTVTAGGAGGVATLGGTLNITLTNGFSPTNGATFTFLTALSRVGAFATFNYPSNDIGMQLNLGVTSASIKITNLKPVVANPIVAPAAVTYGAAFNFQFPTNTFTDPDGDSLTYTATGMPSGITFTGATRTFSGNPSQAGVFAVTVFANDGGVPNLIATNSFTITVNPATLTIAAQPQTKTYGAIDPALTFTATGLQFTDTTGTVLTGVLARAAGETVAGSPYAITQGTLTANNNYTISFTGSTLAITAATLTIAAQPKTKIYGATDPALTFTTSGLQFSDTTGTVLTGALTRAAGETVAGSPYAIALGTLTANGNYAISFTGSTLAITPAALTITASARSKTYGSVLTLNGTSDFTAAGLVNSETIGSVTLTASGSPAGTATNAAVGAYTITPGAATGGTFTPANYAITHTNGTLTVNKAVLSVTADDKTKIYGAVDPAFTATNSGFVNGETAAVLGGTLVFNRAPGENFGSYLITPSGLTSGNYAITFNAGSLTVNKATLTITADTKTKTYGAVDPALTFVVSGLQFSDTSGTVLAGALTRVAGETVAGGPYAISQGTLTPNGNYIISFMGNTLTITKTALSITADAKTKVYGAADPVFTVTYTGLVNGETSAVLGGTLAFVRAPGENAGSYLITPSDQTSGNYAITFNTDTLDVTKAVLSVTANPITKTYGAVDPTLTFAVAGLKFSDTAATVLTGVLTRVGGETVAGSTYAITQGTLTPNGNYTISFTGNTLTISKAPLSVTADAKTKTYGATDPAFTVGYAGFVNGETSAVLGGTLAFARAPGENVGSYLITPSGLTSANYSLTTFNTGSLTINKAGLTITADAKTKTYGAVDPALTFFVSGLQFSDTSGTVLAGALTRVAGETVAGSPYAITQGTLTPNGNYTISFTGNTLTITKAALSVTADAKTKGYGAVDPVFTVTYVGFVNGETSAVLGGTLAFARVPGENVGSYLITPSGLTSGNYAITFNTGSLNTTKAALSVTADAKTKTYGAADPAFTVTYAGFVNSETPAALGGTLTFTRVPGETVGAYLITPSGLTSVNYAITFNTGTLTITTPAPLMLPLTRVGTTNIVITWSAVSSGTYRVQYNPVLSSTNWTDLIGDVAATGGTASKTDILTTTNRFYRVRVLP